MDLGSLIFGILSLACFIVPVIYLQRVKEVERKKFLKEFIAIAEKQQLQVLQCDFWNHNYAIGMDAQKHKLFYLKKGAEQEEQVIIDLAEVESCSLLKLSRTVKIKDESTRVVDRIGLSFKFHKPMKAEQTLSLYNKEESMSVNDELELAEKWVGIINAKLQVLKVANVPAPSEQKKAVFPLAG